MSTPTAKQHSKKPPIFYCSTCLNVLQPQPTTTGQERGPDVAHCACKDLVWFFEKGSPAPVAHKGERLSGGCEDPRLY